MKTISTRQTLFFSISGGSLILIALSFGIYVLLGEIEKSESRVYAKIAEEKWQYNRLRSFESISDQIKKITECPQVFCERILDKDRRVDYFTFLDETAKKRDVFVQDVLIEKEDVSKKNKKTKEEKKGEIVDYGENVEPFDLRLRIKGSYENIYSFLHDMENAPIVIHTQFFSLSIADEKDDKIPTRSSSLTETENPNFTFESSNEDKQDVYDADTYVNAEMVFRTYVRKTLQEEKK